MSIVRIASALATKTAFAAGLNSLGALGSRFINWHPQPALPCVISACVYTAFEYSSIKAQEFLCRQNAPSHHLKERGYQKHQVERMRLISAIIGAIAAAILTPRISQRLGYSMSLRASITFTLPSLLFSYLTPPSKRQGF